MSVSYAIIGCRHAHIAIFIEEMQALGATCAGLWEPDDPAMTQRLSEKYGIPVVGDKEALLADPSIAIIASSAVNSDKIDLVEACERHGKHVMLDKPAVTNREQLERLEAVIARGRIQIGMLLTERTRPATIALKRLIDSGELGNIVAITMRKPHRLSPATRASWHFSKQHNGGILIDLFVHDFDLLRLLTGTEIVSTQSVMAKNVLPEHPDFYDTAAVQAVLEGGIVAQLYADWHTADRSWTWGDCRVFVSGTKGSAELRLCGDPSVSEAEELALAVSGERALEQLRLEEAQPEVSLAQDLLDRIAGKPGMLTHRDIVQASRATVEADERAVVWSRFA